MNVLFLTGAGISANSGIPTYRGSGSTWTDPELEKKSHASRYGNHLDELWDNHWGPMSVKMQKAEPTKSHLAIAEFQRKNLCVIATQNIDDLHERANSTSVAHLHGKMKLRCIRCKASGFEINWTEGSPDCPNCNRKRTRPDVVLFGERLNQRLFSGMEAFAQNADAIVSIGTSLNVFPAANLVMNNAGKSIIINRTKTPFDKFAKVVIQDDCDDVIEDVLTSLETMV